MTLIIWQSAKNSQGLRGLPPAAVPLARLPPGRVCGVTRRLTCNAGARPSVKLIGASKSAPMRKGGPDDKHVHTERRQDSGRQQ